MAERQPLFAVALTVLAYAIAEIIWRRARRNALLNPVLIATAAIAGFLTYFDMPYDSYFKQAAPISETLSLLIILLAVPLCRQFFLIREAGMPIGASLLIGAIVALIGALTLPVAFDVGDGLLATIAPKSATTAVAVEIADRLGGRSGLTAVIVISTGIFGAAFGIPILRAVGVRDDRAIGFALGVASHGIGMARAFQLSEPAGAFASLGMILHAVLAILLVPLALEAI